jgi:hypothetical protein
MTRSLYKRFATLFIVSAIFCSQAGAQTSTSSGGNVFTSWGYYSWQVDQGTLTTTLTTETGFSTAPPGGGYQIAVNTPASRTIHEVHGNVSFTVWSTSSCSVGTMIAQVRDQSGNNVASVNLEDITNNASNDIPIKGTFPSGLSITSLQLTSYNSQCGAITLSWSLVMS